MINELTYARNSSVINKTLLQNFLKYLHWKELKTYVPNIMMRETESEMNKFVVRSESN